MWLLLLQPPSQPRSCLKKEPRAPPAPLCPPVGAGSPPLSLQEEQEAQLTRRQCSDSQAQLQFCGNKTLPCLTGRKKIRTNVLRKGGAGQPSQSKQALREGCGEEGTCVSQQTLAGCAEDRNGFLMLSSGTRWFFQSPDTDPTDALI